MKVLVSNGSYRFHLAPLAVELSRMGILEELLVAGWPLGWQKALANKFSSNAGVARFLDREETIDSKLIYSLPVVEAILKTGDLCRKYSQKIQQKLHVVGYREFASTASKRLKELGPDIYHYRCAYGLQSVAVARGLGIPTLCDHSIAHPAHINFLVENQGVFPSFIPVPTMPLYQAMFEDIRNADFLLVNSDFVRKSCILAGIPQERIFVVYLGIDEKFFSLIPQLAVKKPHSMLYAGGIEPRKGIYTLISSMGNLRGTYHLNVAGGISPEAKKNPVLMDFFSNSKVNYLGGLSRSGLAQLMADSSIFVFPSYCEGSARVIFEAMSAGCFIITTPNSGSIVSHGEHGYLVPPGDVIALTAAIEDALARPEMVAQIGKRNSELVRTQYRQKDYALKVANVYDTILDNIQKQGVST